MTPPIDVQPALDRIGSPAAVFEPVRQPSLRYAWYVLGVLACISVLNYFDRNVLTILIEPIKRDLHATDAQIGLLTGAAFALIYAISAVPAARFADRSGRVRVLSVAVGLWSVMTALGGFATNIATLFAARFGVGIGEAGGLPAAHALVADYFPVHRRATALSVISVAATVGFPLGLYVGGAINDALGWRAAFWIAGAPGLLVTLLAVLTIREPRRAQAGLAGDPSSTPTFTEALRILWRRRSYVYFCAGNALIYVTAYAMLTWTPSFFIRSFHATTSEAGLWFAIANGPGATAGVLLSGVLMDQMMKRDTRWGLWLVLISFGGSMPLLVLTYATSSYRVAIVATLVTGLLGAIATSPAYALVQALAGSRLRATAAAIFMMITNVVGMALGPPLTGLLSDALAPSLGASALRYALLISTVFGFVGVGFLLLALRTVCADIKEALCD